VAFGEVTDFPGEISGVHVSGSGNANRELTVMRERT
jgi:hypothetical protein